MALLNVLPSLLPSPRASQVSTQQEQPDHPLPRVFRSAAPAVAVIAAVVVSQEQPDQGRAWAKAGVPPAPAVIRTVSTAQEQPDQPQSSTTLSVQAVAAVVLPAVNRQVYTSQERPDLAFAALLPSIQGPNVAGLPQVDQYTYTTQEQPDFTPGWARIGVPPTTPVVTFSAVNRAAISTRQDDIDYAFVALEMSIPGPNQVPPPFARAITVQETPNDIVGPPWAKPGLPPISVAISAVRRQVYTAQELPDHPLPKARAGVQPPANFVSPSVSTEVFTTQEQPFHPGSWARIGLPPVVPVITLSAVNRQVQTKQEYPDLAFAALLPSLPSPSLVSLFVSHPSTVQEAPDHPVIQPVLGAPGGKGTFIPPPVIVPATYYMLEDHWIDQKFYLPAGTIQTTRDLGGALPLNWVPTANVDPVDANAVAAYTAVGFQQRGLFRQQFTQIPVTPANYVWQFINGAYVLVKVANFPRVPIGDPQG